MIELAGSQDCEAKSVPAISSSGGASVEKIAAVGLTADVGLTVVVLRNLLRMLE